MCVTYGRFGYHDPNDARVAFPGPDLFKACGVLFGLKAERLRWRRRKDNDIISQPIYSNVSFLLCVYVWLCVHVSMTTTRAPRNRITVNPRMPLDPSLQRIRTQDVLRCGTRASQRKHAEVGGEDLNRPPEPPKALFALSLVSRLSCSGNSRLAVRDGHNLRGC